MWKLSSESGDEQRIARRLRQYGVEQVVYNYIGARWLRQWSLAFQWNDRMLATYIQFCGRYLDPVWTSPTLDHDEGGFVLFSIRRSPARPPFQVHYLPGAEVPSRPAGILAMPTGSRLPILHARDLARRHPSALPLAAELGEMLARSGEWRESYMSLRSVVAAGIRDGSSFSAFAAAAANLGKFEDAEFAYRVAALRRRPHDPRIYAMLTGVVQALASRDHQLNRVDQARVRLTGILDELIKLRRLVPADRITDLEVIITSVKKQLVDLSAKGTTSGPVPNNWACLILGGNEGVET
jgi:hypothetical protein